MNILHLSDIHFGRNHYNISEPFSRKDEILDALLSALSSLPSVMKPDLILVTGDIAWYGKASEYDEAYEWFGRLLECLDMDGEQLVFCPGNHDVNRGAAIPFTESDLLNDDGKLDIGKCDWYYQYENAHLLEARFYNYNCFCQRRGMQPYAYRLEDGSREYSYLIGSSNFSFADCKYCIACFNTAYLPYGQVLSDDQMFLGLPQIERLREDGQLWGPEKGDRDDVFRIALFHHADRFLHPNEQCEYDGRKAPLSLLLQSVDLALCGHTETGGMPVVRAYRDGGSLLTGGAAYYNDEHPNSFSLIHIDERTKDMEVCSFYYNGDRWQSFTDTGKYHWRRQRGYVKWQDALSDRNIYSLTADIDGERYSIGKGHFDIVRNHVDGQEIFEFSNRVEPARCLDLLTEFETLPDGRRVQRIAVRHAPGQWQMIASRLMIAEYKYFLSGHMEKARQAVLGLTDSSGKFLCGFPMDASGVEQVSGDDNIRWYKALQELELFYDVRFLHPYPQNPTESEVDAVGWLRELKNMGNLCLRVDIEESFFVAHNLEEITWAQQVGTIQGGIVFHFTRKMAFHLFGTVIPLEECDIYLKGFQVKDMDEVNRRRRTWEEGDTRRIETVALEPVEWWLIPKDGGVKKDTIGLEGLYVVSLPDEAPLQLPDAMKDFIVECT